MQVSSVYFVALNQRLLWQYRGLLGMHAKKGARKSGLVQTSEPGTEKCPPLWHKENANKIWGGNRREYEKGEDKKT